MFCLQPSPPSCDCAKRNGLQDRCEDPGCKPPTAQCLASNPGPCCPPSMGMTGRKNQQQVLASRHQNTAGVGRDLSNPTGTAFANCTSKQSLMNKLNTAPDDQKLACFCYADPDELPTGQKFLCCPSPDYQ